MENSTNQPWYRRVARWGQTNITEIDPLRYDLDFWRSHWRDTRVQGVIINAGGIVAYYPSTLPWTYHAEFLNGRDLFGALVQAAREDGLAVLARMDSNRVHENVFKEHPDWIAVDAGGQPYRAGGLYVTSVDSPYYEDYLPAVLREIAARYHPDGFADNSFSGLGRDSIDYSPHAARRFREATGRDLPRRKDWDDPAYRQWIEWSYDRRLEIWDINNRAAQEAGGPDCLWIGMVGSDPIGQGAGFRDLRRIARRAQMLLLDSQSRPTGGPVTAPGSFKANSDAGHLLHNLLGWDRRIAESMAMYEHAGGAPFRLASKPRAEAVLWAAEGIAGGLQPWWHHIGAYHEDRRQYQTARELWQWHANHEEYLFDRKPVAAVGIVWSQRNADFYGRDEARVKVDLPYQGMTRALLGARIPYVPLHADDLERVVAEGELRALVLPNVGALSDSHLAAIRTFVERGGGLLATGESGRYDAWGDPRPTWELGELLGVQAAGQPQGSLTPSAAGWEDWSQHSYLRLYPSNHGYLYGPSQEFAGPFGGPDEFEPDPDTVDRDNPRHDLLVGFDDTDLLPFGGRIESVAAIARGGTAGLAGPLGGSLFVPARFVAPCPVYPPETAWMRVPQGTLPALVAQEQAGPGQRGRTVYLAADLDRCFARNPLPDYARLLANSMLWVMAYATPFTVTGPGLLDCRLFRQVVDGDERHILHIVNLTHSEPRPAWDYVPVHGIHVRLDIPRIHTDQARLLVSGQAVGMAYLNGALHLTVPRILDHEVIVIE